MKTHQFSAVVVAAGFMIQVVAAYDIQISTNSFGVLFEDASISEGLKAFIVADVQRCYDAWGTNLVMRTSRATTHVMRVYPKVFGWPFYIEGVPDDDLNVPRNIATNEYGQMMLRVPARLVQKYSDALAFKTNNLAKVLAADVFVDFLSSPEFANVTSNNASDYFLFKDLPPQDHAEIGEGVLQDISAQEFFPPSILGFTCNEKGPEGTNLWVFIPTSLKKKGALWSYDVLPAIWHDGKWKFSFWDAQE
jgi:hypothetical protein